ncbi:MAG: polymerase ECF-type sigma factor [Segetibacter sp.]|nr:polymerase ECF-type sigma factor [Segetibacter sp.]
MPPTIELKARNANHVSLSNDIKFDDASFEIFFKENFKPLCVYAQYKFGFDLDLAKEAVHSSFIKLWESRETISPEPSPKAYLSRIVTNTCLDILKHNKVKQKHEKFILQTASEADNSEGLLGADFKQLNFDIDKAVAELPEQMRRVFELCRYEGLKYADISRHLKISVKTVETQMSRALVKLRQKLANYITPYFIVFLLLS